MENVKLLEGLFKASQEKGKEYLIYLDVDRLLAPCYEAVSKTPKAARYGGWESTQIAGHSVGHWLSAAAAMYVVTKDAKLKQKIDYAIDELKLIQSFDGEGYVSGFPRDCFEQTFTGNFEVGNFSLGGSWVPWYSIDKIYAGLIDVYTLLGNEKALEIVIKLADWAKRGTDNLTDKQFQRMLICEHGGMNEVMADLYNITKNKDYLNLAIRFCHRAILDPLSKGIDELEGKHANTQIPKVLGAAKLYEITGEDYYKNIATFFWNEVTVNRSYIIGGNSIDEHFGPVNQEKLGIQTNETCNTYNMLKLTQILYRWEQKSAYMDFYEKALYNHILASQDPDSGMKMYFVPTQPGHFKIYNSADDSFWCCTGTGMENPARYNNDIYFQKDDQIFVNLFIASEWSNEDKGFILKQETNFPYSEKVLLRFEKAEACNLTLKIRVPHWVANDIGVTVNGKEVQVDVRSEYISIDSNWHTGDEISFELPMELQTYEAKDDPLKVGIIYGPIVLAGELGRENFPETDILDDHLKLNNHPLIDVPSLIADKNNIKEWIKRVDDNSLKFETDAVGQPGNVKMSLIPFYELHHQRYTIYWNMMDEETYKDFVDTEKEQYDQLREVTVDFVQPGEQQPEVEHRMKEKNSNAGYLNIVQSRWRDVRNEGFFSYEMAVESGKQMYLQVSYYGGDRNLYADGKVHERDFTISIDDTVIANQQLKGQKENVLFDVYYDIPAELIDGKDKVEVKFSSAAGKVAGAVFSVRMMNARI
ncbi:glycoside hydrolase family 127 protein [Pseudogracilibacillus auburnensis]|uniref:glycoside hydrolase family 127 protein n=1 Tax=Pseudogracilibacillus auburnensis TaxID=1494959 RepID=UPI001A956DA9|nr:glycoside hydrolase family 127 protein [Pseudogracilibacillus auburnensis]MBO1005128.1 glycoside hydrolase family 127 protein [Pseudogracilibacillus auburnensis]